MGEVTAEMKPLEMPGWISPGQVGKNLNSGKAGGQRGCVWSYTALALMGCYSSLEIPGKTHWDSWDCPAPSLLLSPWRVASGPAVSAFKSRSYHLPAG